MITVTLEDTAFQAAMAHLKRAGATPRPLLQEIGEHLVETTKQRFETSRSPDGNLWDANRPSTLDRYLARYKGAFKKDGSLSKAGKARAGNKKPLIGETRALSTTIHYLVGASALEVGSSRIQAGVQQFGAAARSFSGGRSPWGDIPARPFLGLSVADRAAILEMARDYLGDAVDGSAA
jgi:phage virion morphogenesis protein